MTAARTVSQLPQSHNSVPRHGILTLYGYGIQVRVERGHLLLEDGVGADRRRYRLPRVNHGLRRLTVIGSDGLVSLAALRWLADQKASFVMLERDGSVLVTTGPVSSSDAKLRRAQALAHSSGAAVRISRELIIQKLAGQERVAQNKLLDSSTAQTIARLRAAVEAADTISAIRLLESQGALAYWSAWRNLPINFPKNALARVPDHWRRFGSRHSQLTGSPRLAVNPPNAILNYLYAVLESEARLAVAAIGLDPGLGVLHVDSTSRDSLALDVMEPIRPQIDAYLLDWITRESLSRDWFFEQRDGNCRLMAPFAVRLSETARTWARAVAPFAEWVAQSFWSRDRKPVCAEKTLPTRLTQRRRSEGRGKEFVLDTTPAPRPENVCHGCGKTIKDGRANCADCAIGVSTQRLKTAARLGREAARNPEARAKHVASRRRHAQACSAWDASKQPAWLTTEVFTQRIQPLLANIPTASIRSEINVSRWYAGKIRQGYRPHPRHWRGLAELVGISGDSSTENKER